MKHYIPFMATHNADALAHAERCWAYHDILDEAEVLSWVWLFRWVGMPV